jgi:hypothetical protein
MSITLFCLVKGSATANAFEVDIEKDKSVSHLKKVIKAEKAPVFDNFPADELKLWKVEISGDHDPLSNLSLQDNDELLAINETINHCIVLVNQIKKLMFFIIKKIGRVFLTKN